MELVMVEWVGAASEEAGHADMPNTWPTCRLHRTVGFLVAHELDRVVLAQSYAWSHDGRRLLGIITIPIQAVLSYAYLGDALNARWLPSLEDARRAYRPWKEVREEAATTE